MADMTRSDPSTGPPSPLTHVEELQRGSGGHVAHISQLQAWPDAADADQDHAYVQADLDPELAERSGKIFPTYTPEGAQAPSAAPDSGGAPRQQRWRAQSTSVPSASDLESQAQSPSAPASADLAVATGPACGEAAERKVAWSAGCSAPPAPPPEHVSFEEFMATERLPIQRTLCLVGAFVLVCNCLGDVSDDEGSLKGWPWQTAAGRMAFFHNLSGAVVCLLAFGFSRLGQWGSHRFLRHWYLAAVMVIFFLFEAHLWPAGSLWDAPEHFKTDVCDEAAPPIFVWLISVAGSSQWRYQLTAIFAMYAYVIPLKLHAVPPELRVDLGLTNGISLAFSSITALATGYLREREAFQRYEAIFRRRLRLQADSSRRPSVAERESRRGSAVEPEGADVERLAARRALAAAAAAETLPRRWLRKLTLSFPDAEEEEGFRRWCVRNARARSFFYAAGLLVAFSVVSITLWNRQRRSPDPVNAPRVLGTLLGGGALPGLLILSVAAVPRLWRGVFSRGWAHQYAIVAGVVAAESACLALIAMLPGGRRNKTTDDGAIWWSLVILSDAVPLVMVTLRVRFAWALGALGVCLVPFATAAALPDRGTRIVSIFAPFAGLAVAACRDTERERRQLWRELVESAAAARAARGSLRLARFDSRIQVATLQRALEEAAEELEAPAAEGQAAAAGAGGGP